MSTLKNLQRQFLQLTAILSFALTVNAQDSKKPEPPQRPNLSVSIRSTNVSTVDDVVTLSFNLLQSVDEVSLKVQSFKAQLQGSDFDPSLLLTQINECTSAAGNIGSTSPALIEKITDMVSNIKDLHIPILKIPLALKNLNEARKAIQYCVGYTKYLVSSAIPDMKNAQQKNDVSRVNTMSN